MSRKTMSTRTMFTRTTPTLTAGGRPTPLSAFRAPRLVKLVSIFAGGLLALTACAGAASDPDSDEPPIDSGPGSGVEETPGDPIPIEGIDGTWTFADGTDSAGGITTGDRGADSTITLTISGNSLSGQSACNSYTASFAGQASELSIGSVASTKRACESTLMDFDSRYFTALSTVTAAIPTGGSLVLQGDGVVMNFLPQNSLPEQ